MRRAALSPSVRTQSLALAIGALLAAIVLSLVVGPHGVAWPDPLALALRLERAVLAALVGAALGCTGAALQALLRNVLAEPFVIGVSGGAALGGALPLVLSSAALAIVTVPLGAVVGALVASLLLTLFLARDRRSESHATLLFGIAMNAFASALITVMKALLPPDKTSALLFWLTGSIGYVDVTTLALVALLVVAAIAILVVLAGDLELLALGDGEAARLGVDVVRVRVLAYLGCSLAIGAVVPVSGLIGFVGVVVPHALRLTLSSDMRLLIPLSAATGSLALVVVDGLSRASFALFSTELPVGALTAAIGAPFFAVALYRDATREARP